MLLISWLVLSFCQVEHRKRHWSITLEQLRIEEALLALHVLLCSAGKVLEYHARLHLFVSVFVSFGRVRTSDDIRKVCCAPVHSFYTVSVIHLSHSGIHLSVNDFVAVLNGLFTLFNSQIKVQAAIRLSRYDDIRKTPGDRRSVFTVH